MGFKSNQSQATQGNSIKPEGDYECIITAIKETVTSRGAKGLNFKLVIRNDIPEQKYHNACIFHTIWRKKEPNEYDMQVEGYNYGQLMAMGRAAALPDGKDYESLKQYCEDLLKKCVRVTLKHEEYNGKPQERVSYVNPTKFPECRHKFKDQAVSSNTFANQAAPAEDALSDDGVPF